VNVDGTRSLAEAALRAGVRTFIHMSSRAVYGPPGGGPDRAEDALTVPSDTYGASKLAGEKALREVLGDQVAWTILRPPGVFGAQSVVIRELVQAVRRRRFWITPRGDEWINPIYVEDLAQAIAAVATEPIPGLLNLGGDERLLMEDFRDQVAIIAGTPRWRWRLPPALAWPAAQILGLRHRGHSAARRVLIDKARGRLLNGAVSIARFQAHYPVRFTPLSRALQSSVDAIRSARAVEL